MRYRVFSFVIFILFFQGLLAQSPWIGSYHGVVNGDSVLLEFSSLQEGVLSGTMRDSYNSYTLEGGISDSLFTGTAHEAALGLTFNMTSLLSGDVLSTRLTLDFFGLQNTTDMYLTRKRKVPVAVTPSPLPAAEKNPVSDKTRDKAVAGLWSKESNYSSGYGSNNTYGSMSSKEYLEFLADGRLASGGSSTVIGGGNYTGYSSDTGQQIAEGWFWYTENKKIYLHITQQGQSQTVALGKYYIENGRMLITADNGVKMLLTRE